MSFKVRFQIYLSRKGVSGGILVYQRVTDNQKGRELRPDILNDRGYVETSWSDAFNGEQIDVFCHTDGVNSGTPAFVHRVTLRAGPIQEIHVEPNTRGKWWD